MAQNELKKFIIESGLYDKYSKARHNTYLQNIGESFEGETLNDFECFVSREYVDNWFSIVCECERIGSTSRQRIKRLKQRVKALLEEGTCLFLTFTFSNETIDKTTIHERRCLVSSFLDSLKCGYVGNIDYGKQNEREHYHAVVCCEKVDYTLWHQYGAIKGEKVRLKGKCENKLARYIDKLSLHALKETTYRNRLLYSKRSTVV